MLFLFPASHGSFTSWDSHSLANHIPVFLLHWFLCHGAQAHRKKSFPTLQRVRPKVLLGPNCRVPSASHKVSADHWQLSPTCQSMSWVAGGQDEVPGESVACVCRLLAERMRCMPDRLKPRLFWIYQGDAGGCFSPEPFFGTLNSPVLAITSVLSSFAFGRQWRGDLKWHRVITTTYT